MNQEKVLKSIKMENSWIRGEYIVRFGTQEQILNEILGIHQKIPLTSSEK